MDRVVLGAIRDALDERVVHEAVDLAFEQLRRDKAPDEARRSQRSLNSRRLSSGFSGVSMPSWTASAPPRSYQHASERRSPKAVPHKELERLRSLECRLPGHRAPQEGSAPAGRGNGRLLGRHTAQARQALRRLLVDKIDMAPVIEAGRRGYRLSGRLTFGRLLQGEAAQLVQVGGNSRSVVAPYLKALRSPSAILVDGSLALFFDADP